MLLYLDFGTNSLLDGSRSSSVRQSVDYSMTVQRRSLSDSLPFWIGPLADIAANIPVNGNSMSCKYRAWFTV